MIFFNNAIGIILRWKDFNYTFEIDISRNHFQKNVGVLRRDF